VKQSVYFFRCGMTRDISLISRRIRSLPIAVLTPIADGAGFLCTFVPLKTSLLVSSSSRRRFFDAGSDLGGGTRLQTWREIWLKSSI